MYLAWLAAKAVGLSQTGTRTAAAMFERNRIDTNVQMTAVPAHVTLTDGTELKGKFIIPSNRPVADVLNGAGTFVDFETYSGDRALLAKARFASVRVMAVPQAANLKARISDSFDPYSVLGVSRSATWDEIRNAYLGLSKTYHPDRYAGADLPPEVREYLAAMARRINAAFAELEQPLLAQRRIETQKAKPIFTSSPSRT
jgi:hypothetical protein